MSAVTKWTKLLGSEGFSDELKSALHEQPWETIYKDVLIVLAGRLQTQLVMPTDLDLELSKKGLEVARKVIASLARCLPGYVDIHSQRRQVEFETFCEMRRRDILDIFGLIEENRSELIKRKISRLVVELGNKSAHLRAY